MRKQLVFYTVKLTFIFTLSGMLAFVQEGSEFAHRASPPPDIEDLTVNCISADMAELLAGILDKHVSQRAGTRYPIVGAEFLG